MNFQSRSSSLSAGPQLVRRPSVSSRLSSAVSIAERGETHDGGGIAAQHQIEEEIAKIKRYEVRLPRPLRPAPLLLLQVAAADMCISALGLHHHRYASILLPAPAPSSRLANRTKTGSRMLRGSSYGERHGGNGRPGSMAPASPTGGRGYWKPTMLPRGGSSLPSSALPSG